jgi:DNA mismatch endonuclease (patch repair protein)
MADIVDQSTRSRMMSGIRGRDTRPEMQVRRGLHALGLRYRLHARALPGCPDLVLSGPGVAVFVHGCFWHGHDRCRYFRVPATRQDFWKGKLRKNQERDQRNLSLLQAQGWRVAVVWECAVRHGSPALFAEVAGFIRNPASGNLREWRAG